MTERPILITGAGTLGVALGRAAHARGLPCHLLSRADLDIADASAVDAALERYEPSAVINAAGYVHVDAAELDAVRCFRENVAGPRVLAGACGTARLPLVSFSSHLVFDGRRRSGYVERDAPRPLSMYGRSKVAAERVLLECADALVIRSAAFFGAWHGRDFLSQALAHLAARRKVYAPADVVVTPTYVPDLANASLNLLLRGECGVWHVTHEEAFSWAELARRAAILCGLDPALVQHGEGNALGVLARWPQCSALRSERGHLLRPFRDALAAFVREQGRPIASEAGAAPADALATSDA